MITSYNSSIFFKSEIMDPDVTQNSNQKKDANVMSFMMQLVQEKHGDEIEYTFLNSESEKLYNQFGDKLVSYFEPQLSEEQKTKFDKMIADSMGQDEMLNFLVDSIPDLEEQIMQVLIEYRAEYLGEDLGERVD